MSQNNCKFSPFAGRLSKQTASTFIEILTNFLSDLRWFVKKNLSRELLNVYKKIVQHEYLIAIVCCANYRVSRNDTRYTELYS